jgi:hypothetical protein
VKVFRSHPSRLRGDRAKRRKKLARFFRPPK